MSMTNKLITAITSTITISLLSVSMAQADLQIKAQKATPKMGSFAAHGAPKPATCGPGFTAVGKKLVTHEGKKWYQYTCARQETIIRTCNADTDVTDVKDKIISLPSDGQSKKSKLQLSYKCFHYVPVK